MISLLGFLTLFAIVPRTICQHLSPLSSPPLGAVLQDNLAFVTPGPVYAVHLPRALVRRACGSGYVTHNGGCCLATVIHTCNDGQVLCTATCPPASSTTAAACPSGYVTHDTGCCLANSLKDCGNGVTVCTAACPTTSTTPIVITTTQALITSTTSISTTSISTSHTSTSSTSSSTATLVLQITSSPTSNVLSPSSLEVTYTTTLVSTIDSTAILAILQTGVPTSAQACFLNSKYTSIYSTPSWYIALPTSAPSYFSSVNNGNTASCTTANTTVSGGANSSRLSKGAIAGIAIGAIVGIAALALLAWFLIARAGRAGSSGHSHTPIVAYGSPVHEMSDAPYALDQPTLEQRIQR